jgi:hypothetical protein
METNTLNNNYKYICDYCYYKCNKTNDWLKHINTQKHIQNSIKEVKNHSAFTCKKCQKSYNNRSGLWKHNKTCINESENNSIIIQDNNEVINISNNENNENNENNNHTNNQNSNNEIILLTSENITEDNNESKDKIIHFFVKDYSDFKNLIIDVVKNNNELVKQNQEFQEKMFELMKNSNSVTNNNMNICNNQNNFNLQFFLNETCKDAMNMSDFINSFDLKMSDLERLGEDGYVNTMSRIIINKVRELDVEKRPIHCSDARREIIYIKDDGVWVKDDEDKTKLRTVVNKVGGKNINILYKWQASHPDYSDPESPDNTTYLNIMMEVMGGKNTRGNEDKVIKRIIKEVVIDKENYIKIK